LADERRVIILRRFRDLTAYFRPRPTATWSRMVSVGFRIAKRL
jgi:hypothetical protein